MPSEIQPQDTLSSAGAAAPWSDPIWQPFPDLDSVVVDMSLKCDGSMSWNGHPHEEIVRNRLRYFESKGLYPQNAVGADQVHGANVYRVTRADAGRGTLDRDSRIPATDAMITNERGVILTTLHADCAPVFYVDPERRVIGLAHAGRRGIIAGIAGNVIRRMSAEFGCVARTIHVSVGPTISTHAYEVEPSIAEEFAARFGQQVIFREEGRTFLDLFSAITIDLLEAGLNLSLSPVRPPCTLSNPQYSSYRRDGSPVNSMLAWLTIT